MRRIRFSVGYVLSLGIVLLLRAAAGPNEAQIAGTKSSDHLDAVDLNAKPLRLLYLNSSGAVVKPIDIPAGRKPLEWGEPDSNPSIRQEARTYLASVFFSASDQNILVWRRNSDDPILELRPGGAVREVPLQIPHGYRFVDMLTANDRWVAHFRTQETSSDARMSKKTDSYYEVRPQDGSIAARLVEKGDASPTIACESNGTYTAFKMSDTGKLILLKAD